MFKQMVQLWIAIPIIMTVIVLVSFIFDVTYRFVDNNQIAVGYGVLAISLTGLIASTYAWLKWK